MNLVDVALVVITQKTVAALIPRIMMDGVFPSDWEVSDDSPAMLPGLIKLQFKNGVVFTVQGRRLQLADSEPTEDMTVTRLPEVMKSLLEQIVTMLPDTKFVAAGVNITGALEMPKASQVMIDLFLKPGPWNESPLVPEEIGLRLSYPVEGAKLNLDLTPMRVVTEEDVEVNVIWVKSNYHTSIKDRSVDGVYAAVAAYRSRYSQLQQVIAKLFSEVKL